MRYPSNQIQENLYTKGFEFMLKQTYGNYVGFYHSVAGKYFAGTKFIISNTLELLRYDSKKQKSSYQISQLDLIYTKLKPEIINKIKKDDFEIIKIPPQFSPIPYMRYFIKRKNEINAPIMEVNEDTYNNARLSEFYYVGSIIWGDISINLSSLIQPLEQTIPGISFYLGNISSPPGPDFS
jgi:hypothetical protein